MSNAGWMAILLSLSVTSFPGLTRSAFAAERAGRLSPLRIAIVSRSTLDMPFYVARERGFFREEGLEAELIFMKANLTVQGMLGGSIDFGTATGTAVSAAVNGADVRVVFAMSDKPSFDLIAQPSITSVQQLRGTSDVTYVALKAGVIDATMVQIPQNFLAQDEGFRKLASGADFYRAVQGGLATTKATVSERPELVAKAIRATMRAVRLIANDKKYALEFMKGPYLDLGKERERFAERAYTAAVQGYLLSGVVDEKVQREMITVAAQRVKPQQPVTPERVFDFSFARKISEAVR